MHQRRWIELFSDYDCKIRYHPGKANAVDDELSRKERVKPRRVHTMSMTIQSSVKDKILAAQSKTSKAENLKCKDINYGQVSCIELEIPEWKWDIITMDFITRFPRSSSGYDTNWVIIGRLTRSAYFLAIHEGYKMEKLARLCNDEIVARNGVHVSIISDRYLYGRKYIRESRLIRPELVQETTDKVVLIKERIKDARDRQKRYADSMRNTLEFEVGDQVLLKVSPWKGVVRFRKKGKLAPRYVGPFNIFKRIGLLAYRLRLPRELSSVHDTFYVSNIKKCMADANLHVPLEEIKVDKTLRFVEEHVEIMDCKVKKLKHSRISIVKVRWNSKRGYEDYMKNRSPHLFVEQVIIGCTS
nr:putative reverse transcriptase domain-containing protein [Tanacetum cinerariifolium]